MDRVDEEKMVMDDVVVGYMHQNLLQASDQENWLQGYLQHWGLSLVLLEKVGSWVVVLVDQKAKCVDLVSWHDSS